MVYFKGFNSDDEEYKRSDFVAQEGTNHCK